MQRNFFWGGGVRGVSEMGGGGNFNLFNHIENPFDSWSSRPIYLFKESIKVK